jgi:hypothetical protein
VSDSHSDSFIQKFDKPTCVRHSTKNCVGHSNGKDIASIILFKVL